MAAPSPETRNQPGCLGVHFVHAEERVFPFSLGDPSTPLVSFRTDQHLGSSCCAYYSVSPVSVEVLRGETIGDPAQFLTVSSAVRLLSDSQVSRVRACGC